MTNTVAYYSGEYEMMTEIFDEVFSILSKRSEEAKELYNSTLAVQWYWYIFDAVKRLLP